MSNTITISAEPRRPTLARAPRRWMTSPPRRSHRKHRRLHSKQSLGTIQTWTQSLKLSAGSEEGTLTAPGREKARTCGGEERGEGGPHGADEHAAWQGLEDHPPATPRRQRR
eukprot:3008853-Rhodomonas_salina.2